MRVQNKNVTVRGVIFSRTFALIYFLIVVFFIYKSYTLYPIWSGHYQKNLEVKEEYVEKEQLVKDMKERRENNETDLGKERYEKEFYNKLDEGEEMIVLYEGEAGKTGGESLDLESKPEEKARHMFFWERWYLDTLVWWKNL
jgi:hypothetical protein